jgi:hypothetical protein
VELDHRISAACNYNCTLAESFLVICKNGLWHILLRTYQQLSDFLLSAPCTSKAFKTRNRCPITWCKHGTSRRTMRLWRYSAATSHTWFSKPGTLVWVETNISCRILWVLNKKFTSNVTVIGHDATHYLGTRQQWVRGWDERYDQTTRKRKSLLTSLWFCKTVFSRNL